jgi:tetratricopeptide (TPR) repeat protein
VKQRPHPDHLREYDLVEEVFGPKMRADVDARRLVAHAWLEKARTLAMLGRTSEAITISDRLDAELGNDADPAIRRSVGRALFGKAQSAEDSDALYRRIEAIANMPPAMPGLAAEAAYNRGVSRELKKRPEEAKPIYVALLDTYGESEDFEVRPWVDDAAFGLCRIEFPGIREANDVAPVLARYANATDWREQYLAANALSVIGNGFLRRKQDHEAAAMFVRAHELFGGANNAAPLRALAASMMMNRGVALGHAHGSDAEMRAYDELFAAYSSATEPIVRRWVAASERNACLELQSRHDPVGARERLERLLRLFGNDTGPEPLLRDVAAARSMLAKMRSR